MRVYCLVLFFFSKSSSLFIEELRDVENLAVTSACLDLRDPWSFAWFDSCPMKNYFQIHSNTKGTTSAVMLLLSLSCCRDKRCRDGGCRVRGRTLRSLSFVNSSEVASDKICFWWPLLLMTLLLMTCLQELFFRPVSSDAVLQTHFFRCNLPDALNFK